uniref:DNA 3'-5' helicase n=1 Tax=Blastobotrys adeninivorans TaxID=409370 RepID=A0A060TBV0_BLAAD
MEGDQMEKMINSLNSAQHQAVTAPLDSRLQILAGPGTGKTKTLTSRACYLLHRGVRPQKMIIMTFTNHATKEMKERIIAMTGDRGVSRFLKIGTFHSICLRYLQMFGSKIGLGDRLVILDDADKDSVLQSVMTSEVVVSQLEKLGYKRADKKAVFQMESDAENKVTPKSMSKRISWIKNHPGSLNQLKDKDPLRVIYDKYQSQVSMLDMLDFDDILTRAIDLLTDHPEVVNDIEAVLVDEFQDSSPVQLDLTRLFAQARKHVTVVGDPDQSIYSFRYANPENLKALSTEYPDLEVIYLEQNYRSTQPILDWATTLIRESSFRLGADRKLIGTSLNGGPGKPLIVTFRDDKSESYGIGRQILGLIQASGGMFAFDDFAILSRTREWNTKLELVLNELSIPYRTLGLQRFWDRAEIRTLLDYLRVVNSGKDRPAIVRTINVPKRSIGPSTMTALLEKVTEDTSLLNVMEQVAMGELKWGGMSKALPGKIKGYLDLVRRCRDHINEDPHSTAGLVKAVDVLISEIKPHEIYGVSQENTENRKKNLEEVRNFIGSCDTSAETFEFEPEQGQDVAMTALQLLLQSSSLGSGQEGEGKPKKVVTLSTIHSAKGLEWPVVFAPHCVDAHLVRCNDMKEVDEARRLLFVAGTRAKALLYFTWPLNYTSYGRSESSQLIKFLDRARSPAIGSTVISATAMKTPTQGQLEQIAKLLGRPFTPHRQDTLQSTIQHTSKRTVQHSSSGRSHIQHPRLWSHVPHTQSMHSAAPPKYKGFQSPLISQPGPGSTSQPISAKRPSSQQSSHPLPTSKRSNIGPVSSQRGGLGSFQSPVVGMAFQSPVVGMAGFQSALSVLGDDATNRPKGKTSDRPISKTPTKKGDKSGD